MNLKSSHTSLAFALVGCLVFASGINSQSAAATDKDLQTALATSYVAAKQSKDTAKLLALLHPKVRACMNNANRDYFNYLLMQDLDSFPHGKILKISVVPVAKDALPMVQNFFPAEMFPYPVQPTHDVQLDIEVPAQSATLNSFTALIEVAADNGIWYWVTACPTDKGFEYVRKGMEQAAQQKAQARKLASEIKEPLLSELKSLLATGDRIGAIKKYRETTNTDLTTAHGVIEILDSPQK